MIRLRSRITLFLIFLLSLEFVCFGQMRRKDYRLDSELFRRGLIERGFDDWVKLYDEQHPPMSDLDFLAEQIASVWLKYRRATDSESRERALEKLLSLETDRVESYPEHPLNPIWRIRLASDILNEKYGAFAFISLIDLSLPKHYRNEFSKGLDLIESHLDDAENVLRARLSKFKKLDSSELEKINRQGLPELYFTANVQAESLRAWCLYHRIRIAKAKSTEQVKLLYELDKLLKKLNKEITQGQNGGLTLIDGSVARMMGDYSEAKLLLERANKLTSASYKIFVAIEESLLSLSENKPAIAELQIKQGYKFAKFYQNEKSKYDLIMLSLARLDGKAELMKLSDDARCNRKLRNRIWRKLVSDLERNPQFGELIYDKLVYDTDIAEGCPYSGLGDIEIYARAQDAIEKGKEPFAQSLLKQLLSRQDVSNFIREQATTLLASIFEKQGMFEKAADIVSRNISKIKGSREGNCKLLAELARLSWLAMEAKPNDGKCRNAFIRAARELILGCPDSVYADKFKLLIGNELCDEGKFNEAIQWVEQISPSSKYYLQSRAERVLILTREFKDAIQRSGESNFAKKLADRIESACIDMLTIASAKQKNPDEPEDWKLDESQIRLIGSAILATVNVLTNDNVAKIEKANYLLNKYKPILAKYEKSSGSAVISQIKALLKEADINSIKQAILLMQRASGMESPARKLTIKQKAEIIIAILETIHRYMLNNYAELQASENPICELGLKLAEKNKDELFKKLGELPQREYNKFITIYAIVACDEGKYTLATKLLKSVPKIPQRYKLDVQLLKAKVSYFKQDYISAASETMEILQRVSPVDIRYWQGLIINLSSHLKLGSDPIQIANAIIARQTENNKMGTEATRSKIMEILAEAQRRIRTSQGQSKDKK